MGLLEGVRVLDMSRALAGPLATMILGDLGADVLKVERPATGDESRAWGPPFDHRGESAYYLSCNRNKLGVAADLESDEDRRLLRSLIAGADVVVENFRRGALERRGLDPDALLAAHPRLIWCTITGFGPDSARPGYDFVVQAESGWMAITGEVDGSPMKVGVALADIVAGKDAAIVILASLAGGRSGDAASRRLYVSLQHSAVSALVNVGQSALVTGRDATRWGNAHANLVPYELFEASDRPIVIAVGNDAQYAALARALEVPDLSDGRLKSNAGRMAARDEVVALVRPRIASRTASEWVRRLTSVGVPCGTVRSVLEALGDVASSPVTGVSPLAPLTVRRPPPRLDEHGPIVRERSWGVFTSGSSVPG